MKNIFEMNHYLRLLISFFTLVSSLASAAKLEDVKILSVKSGIDALVLKLHANEAPKDSYFYVSLGKTDPGSFQKMLAVVNKVTQKKNYKLNLDIQSFSPYPSGSFYRSDDITFFSATEREPGSVESVKKPKK
jgi:hypothetical protein